ncbi:MAG: HAMP domain-containing histidine kinase, partial [[Eubacterium] siraeum]|nr:HAMP domain-containing histidine kinase [[Eubacterium] siraeum]
RLDYQADGGREKTQLAAGANIALGLMSAVVLGAMLYVRSKILSPFQKLSSLPYELSRGNLTAPLKENKSRFFGKFVWGMDMLRENMEQQKQRELALQKEKKTLLLSLSHDIKTPLSAIKLYSKALSKNLYPDSQKQCQIAESIDQRANEIEGYLNQIISASREDFLSIEVSNSEFYMKDLIQGIKAYYGEKLSLIKTEFLVGEYENKLIFGDFDRSAEVLQNIIENALKYGDGKLIELLFSDEEEALVSVKNSGCTLRSEELPHIFESFWRGMNSRGIQGSGLGLYICRQLMHKMKGDIFAQIDGDTVTVTAVFRKA